jgi:PAS domain S-box-containing protein
MRLWPRTIRWQIILGLTAVEVLSIGMFAVFLISGQEKEMRHRAVERLALQATSVALQTRDALDQGRDEWILTSLKMMSDAPSVSRAKITDPDGNVLFVSEGIPSQFPLEPAEKAQIARIKGDAPTVFSFGGNRWEGVKPIYLGSALRGYAWVESDRSWDSERLRALLRSTVSFGLIWMGASALLVLLMSRSIARPLRLLQKGTHALMTSTHGDDLFPLPVTVENEFGDLIEAFNSMVASLEEQRAGLNDTLSLLDSMLANAPIGLVFFDRRCRIVRTNEVFANMTGVQLNRHLGRKLSELMPQQVAMRLEGAVAQVIATEKPVQELEVTGPPDKHKWPWTWLITTYPVRTDSNQVRWVGAIVIDASERKRGEEALRRNEKLAATGRLAASIAHEINNPLEAITNLLFLLRKFCQLDGPAENYVAMAQEEVRRMSEITQQTLRFYRQSTLPSRANMTELLDSVLTLYNARLSTLGIRLERKYDPKMDLYCFAGEVRQVIANMVSNAIDATSGGGRLVICARRSRDWKDSGRAGVRFTVADTGSGMDAEEQQHLFEAFFTTKGITGTGLGLWVSSEIIQKHDGRVRVRSRSAASGRPSGTVFQMFFPDDQVLAEPAEPVTQPAEAGAEA